MAATNGNDSLNGTNGADTINGLDGDDTINGAAGNDSLVGGLGDDSLTGGLGDDTLKGGAGNDTYVVDSVNDALTEIVDPGIDTVRSFVDWSLGGSFENLVLLGTAAIDGTGNALANTLTGNSSANILDGRLGADAMAGGAGDDTYLVDNAGDAVTEGLNKGTDLVKSSVSYTLASNVENLILTGTAAINGTGNAIANTLTGNSAANILNGALGADAMAGGVGDDTYIVNDALDAVTEGVNKGTDLVKSSVSYTLTNNVENLTLTGTDTIDGTGNALANTLTGNSAANILNGRVGADAMAGGDGNDTYIVNDALDAVTESLNKGTDLVKSSVSYTLTGNVEDLILTGTDTINGTGNALANTLAGNSAANILNGGVGADAMAGGDGNDTYLVNDAGDAVTEGVNKGMDLVKSSVSYTLGSNVEILTLTGTGAIDGTGNTLVNTMTGNSAANVLDGAGGGDAMAGGAGDDTYFVNDAGDVVTEGLNMGTDLVKSSVSYTLTNNVENLTLTGTDTIDGTGNTLANLLTGNSGANLLNGSAGNDTLDGGAGADGMSGGFGDDTYVVDNALDTVTEGLNKGTDLVRSSVSYTLTNNVENLTLTGAAAIDGTGNAMVNVLTGNDGANTLDGMGGADALHGGLDNDTLIYDASDTQVDGGAGTDTLFMNASGLTLDLAGLSGSVLTDLEQIDLNGLGNTLVTTSGEVNDLSSTGNLLRVLGGASNAVEAGSGWAYTGIASMDSQDYAQYEQGGAILQVDLDIDRSGIAVSGLSLSLLDGTNGFRLSGVAEYDRSGISVSGAGDVNGDGYADLIVGADGAGPGGNLFAGESYVVFGQASGFAANFDLSNLDGANGFRLAGVAVADQSGGSVSGAGDLNGDGFADVIVGAYMADPNGNLSGASYVVFGQASGFASSVELSALNGATGFRISGEAAGDKSGRSVAGAGDLNADGFADLAVGARNASPNGTYSGASYVVFGHATGFAANLELSALNGANGFQLTGAAAGDRIGRSVAGAGDVNGDGIDDLFVGAYTASPNGTFSGASYVVFGQASGFAANLDLSALNGANGFRISGVAGNDFAGGSVAGAGDVNGDGVADLIVGAFGAALHGGDTGSSYVVFGQATGFAANLELSALDGNNGFRISGVAATDRAGRSVSAAGDVNGDGYGDLIVGAYHADPFGIGDAGASYVVFGASSGFASNLELSALDGSNGFRIAGAGSGDYSGISVSSAGDVNGDGFADLLIGSSRAQTDAGMTGAAYVLYGRDFTGAAGIMGSSGADSLSGGAGDVFHAGAGDDGISVDSTSFLLADGGAGADTLALDGSGFTLDLTQVSTRVTGIEAIDLTGSGDNTLVLAAFDVLNLSDTSSTLTVGGDAGDRVTAPAGGWRFTGNVTEGETYAVYANGAATLRVDTDVDRSAIIQSEFDLSLLDGASGFKLSGAAAYDFSGSSVSGAGDVNGDGFADLLVGARNADTNAINSGASYVVFGKGTGFAANLELSNLDGSDGFRLSGVALQDRSGASVSDAGDVNGDGYGDVIVGAYTADSYAGASYVVFGKGTGFSANLELSNLDGSNGFKISGAAAGDQSGNSVSSAGDVNGDGYADLIVGALQASPNGSYSGASYVLFGQASGFAASVLLSTLNGAGGFKISGVAGGDFAGKSVASAGDVNGDGRDDLVIGAWNASPNGGASGASYVLFAQATGFAANVELSALNGANGFKISGAAAFDRAGGSVSAAGDVNGDGYGDLIVGANGADPHGSSSGASYVVFGQASGFASNLELSSLNGANGFRLAGVAADDLSGISVSGAGDVNGDGYDDLIVGAQGADPNGSGSGASYVVFGHGSGFAANLDLSALDGTNGFLLSGEAAADKSGHSVSAAGDVNGDGFADLVIGADYADPNGDRSGAGYVFFGRDFNGAAGAGADTLLGGAGDAIHAGAGDDVISVDSTSFLLADGGAGADTLALDGSGLALDLTQVSTRVSGIEAIDLTGSGSNTLVLSALDLLNLSDTSNTLAVRGNAGDAVQASGVWASAGAVVINTVGYTEYHQYLGSAVLQVQDGVDASSLLVLRPSIDLSSLDGANGFRLDGVAGNDFSGRSVSGAGDVNGDGFADLIVGAYGADPGGNLYAGESYVVFGKASGFASVLDLASLNGTSGFRLDGIAASDLSGSWVASAGNVNGDGFQDLIIGALRADVGVNPDAGGSYVVFGKASGFGSSLSLAALDGTNGFRVDGIDAHDYAGTVASAGDVNGDGYDDLIVGAYRADPGGDLTAGESYVVFGYASGFFSNLDLSALDGTNGFRLDGIDAEDFSGRSVSGAGDVNGDGFDDLIIGATYGDAGGTNAGESYVVFGMSSGFASSLSLGSLNGGNGFRLDGSGNGDFSGRSVASAGDVNGDGYGDLIVGALVADPGGTDNAGASYVVFGMSSGFASNLSLASLNGSNGFRIDGIDVGDLSGFSVASAGDVNGDGYDDLIVGATGGDPGGDSAAGESYVVFGHASGFASNLALSSLDGANGFRLDGIDPNDRSGTQVASAGDVNGDGFADLIIGAPEGDPGGDSAAGESYVFFGRDFSFAAAGTMGTSGADTLSGGAGDVFHAGADDDVISVDSTSFLLADGGAGADTLVLDGSGLALDLTQAATRVSGIEAIDLADGGNELTLNLRDLLDLSDASNQLVVEGGVTDAVSMTSGTWSDNGEISGYHSYTLGAATLLINAAITDVTIVV